MRIGLYPGSFNPWHSGHLDVLKKACKLFDHIVVANYSKDMSGMKCWAPTSMPIKNGECMISYETFNTYLTSYVREQNKEFCAVIRGLRNGHDLQYEMNQQYWYEDLGLKLPIIYFITDRKLAHISSSAIRALDTIKNK